MEDLIYILIAVFWVIFTIMRKSQKKQQAISNDEASPQPKKTSSFEEVLEEILRPREMKPVEIINPTLEEVGIDDASGQFSLETTESEIQSLEVMNSMETLDSEESQTTYTSIHFDEEPEEELKTNYITFDFDVRQAVIYSAILNRPYL